MSTWHLAHDLTEGEAVVGVDDVIRRVVTAVHPLKHLRQAPFSQHAARQAVAGSGAAGRGKFAIAQFAIVSDSERFPNPWRIGICSQVVAVVEAFIVVSSEPTK